MFPVFHCFSWTTMMLKFYASTLSIRVDVYIGLFFFFNGNFNEYVEHLHILITHLQLYKHIAFPTLIILEKIPIISFLHKYLNILFLKDRFSKKSALRFFKSFHVIITMISKNVLFMFQVLYKSPRCASASPKLFCIVLIFIKFNL